MVHEFPDNFSFSKLAGMVCMTDAYTALGWRGNHSSDSGAGDFDSVVLKTFLYYGTEGIHYY